MNERQIHILGAKIDLLSQQEVSDRLKLWLSQTKGRYVVTLNPEIALLAEREDGYQKVLNRSDITVADGIGLRIGAKLFGIAVPPRITGRQIVDMLCKSAVAGRHGIYLLGARPGVAKRAARALQKSYAGLVIAGADEGIPQNRFNDIDVLAPQICERISRSGAHILLVAFGAPKQERFIAKYLSKMPNLRIAVGVGGLFDYVSGEVRAPSRFWRQHGLEWLFRLLTQPKRWHRIFDATAVFLGRVIVWKARIASKYRRNVVGFIVDAKHERVLLVSPWWATENRWQFPQGGIDSGETSEQAVLREMNEELGTSAFRVLRFVPRIHRYEWPKWYQFVKGYKGQDQDVFMLEFTGQDVDIDLSKAAELQHWKWVDKDEVLSQLAQPRREIGAIALSLLD